MKKVLYSLSCGLLLLLAACGQGGQQAAPTPAPAENTSTSANESGADAGEQKSVKVGIIQIVEHPSLDAAREGFIQSLNDAGFVEGENLEIDYKNAQGDMNTNNTIAQKFASDNLDLILAIATPSAQAMANATKETPIVFTAVTDPLGAKLVSSLENPGGNVTGVSDSHPDAIKRTMEMIKEFFPDAKKVGIPYNAGEQNSVVQVDEAKAVLADLGIEAVEATVSNSSEVKQAAESLVSRGATVFYVPTDNTVVSALDTVIMVANEHKVPLVVGETDSVKAGGFASFGFEYYDLGYKVGKMGVEILNGKQPSEIPVGFPDTLDLMINVKAAAEQGVTLTDEMKKNAKLVNE